MSGATLAVRTGGVVDVLLVEPALRALAADGEVDLLCSRAGRSAAPLIPVVGRARVFDLPGLDAEVDPAVIRRVTGAIRALAPRRAVVFTSRLESALPTAFVLRLAGVPFIAARSLERAGPLLDVRLSHDPPDHDVVRNLELVEALGLPAPFDRSLRIRTGASPTRLPVGSVVVQPGDPSATVEGRREADIWESVVTALVAEGCPVVLTGMPNDAAARSMRTIPGLAVDLVGRTTLAQLAGVMNEAAIVCAGRIGPVHLAAAVGTPVVAVVPNGDKPTRWRPWMVDHEVISVRSLPIDVDEIVDAVTRRLSVRVGVA